jgi:hypothetical protein
MNTLPKARTENIVVQNLRDEVLIYDTITNQAFCLNETSSKVFNHCDGATSFEELKRKYRFTDELIYLAIDELKAKNLLDSAANYETPFAGMNRREVIRQVGFATMIALPFISSMIAPTAANAGSGARGNLPDGAKSGTVSRTCGIGRAEYDAACNSETGSRCASGRAVSSGAAEEAAPDQPCVMDCFCESDCC